VFAVTNLFIALLAASLASQLARALAQAGFLEAGSSPLWDSSALLSQDSALGTLLHALAGYDAQPTAAQLLSYLAALAFIVAGTRLLRGAPAPTRI
jgi:high-affinity iron transporter